MLWEPKKKWEYKVIRVNLQNKKTQLEGKPGYNQPEYLAAEELNKHGREGWELIKFEWRMYEGNTDIVCVFKREWRDLV